MHQYVDTITNGLWGSSGFVVLSIALAIGVGVKLGTERLKRRGDRRHALARTTLDAGLAGALALVVTMTVVPVHVWGGWDQVGAGNLANTNLVPFETIRLFLKWGSPEQLTHNLVNNVLLFVPLGWCLALKARDRRPLLFAALGGMLLSTAVEAGQFFLPIGRSTDVDDVILNTAGALVGGLAAVIVLPALRWLAHSRRSGQRLSA